jgi:hypothetical protein
MWDAGRYHKSRWAISQIGNNLLPRVLRPTLHSSSRDSASTGASSPVRASFSLIRHSKRSNLQWSIFVAGILKVLENLVHCSHMHNVTVVTLIHWHVETHIHVEARRIACVDRSDNLSFRFGVQFVPARITP